MLSAPAFHDPFAALSSTQREQLATYAALLREFNRKINLISRETEPYVEERHLRHCLALAARRFPDGCRVVDWGTGGGLPAIPLAILFPEATVHAVDAVGKKIQAVQAMARRLGLTNLHAHHTRAEQFRERVHYSVSRATAPLRDLWRWHAPVAEPFHVELGPQVWRPGLICLKGGDLTQEIAALDAAYPGLEVRVSDLKLLLGGAYFEEKVMVEVWYAG